MATHELFSSQESLALLRKHWGWIALRGVFVLLFGVMTLAVPGVTLGVLVIVWGAYALIDGALAWLPAFVCAKPVGRSGHWSSSACWALVPAWSLSSGTG